MGAGKRRDAASAVLPVGVHDVVPDQYFYQSTAEWPFVGETFQHFHCAFGRDPVHLETHKGPLLI